MALLIRPLLRANAQRHHAAHIVVFFIFVVANGGGLLTPLGDPPLFLGFLRGVPFAWTLRLRPLWAMLSGGAAQIFASSIARCATRASAAPQREPASASRCAIEGACATWLARGCRRRPCWASAWPAGAAPSRGIRRRSARWPRSPGCRSRPRRAGSTSQSVQLGADARGRGGVRRHLRDDGPGAGRSCTSRGASLGLAQPWQFFWASGALSSVLDNAPTYLTFASLAAGVQRGGRPAVGRDLGALAAHPTGHQLLAAVSCGSVFMGANTYIGNGPNFMVKAIAEQHHVRMPSFFGYMVWSLAILLPVLAGIALVVF